LPQRLHSPFRLLDRRPTRAPRARAHKPSQIQACLKWIS
jgi:hypothetical protein